MVDWVLVPNLTMREENRFISVGKEVAHHRSHFRT